MDSEDEDTFNTVSFGPQCRNGDCPIDCVLERTLAKTLMQMTLAKDNEVLNIIHQNKVKPPFLFSIDCQIPEFALVCSCYKFLTDIEISDYVEDSETLTSFLAMVEAGHCDCMEDGQQLKTVWLSLLDYAVLSGNLELVKGLVLLECTQTGDHLIAIFNHALFLAAFHMEINPEVAAEIAKFILQAGADLKMLQNAPEISHKMIKAAMNNNNMTLVHVLLEGGAVIDLDNTKDCAALVAMALRANNEAVVRLLLKAGCSLNGKLRNRNCLLFHYAVMHCTTEIIALFIEHLDDVNVQDMHENTALHHVMGDEKLVGMLVDAGARTDIKDESGMTPLMVGALQDNVDSVERLLAGGADASITTPEGYTALHFATWEGSIDLVRILVRHGCPHDTPTSDGNTPLSLACHGDCLETMVYLIKLGVNVGNLDKDMDSPLLYASFNGSEEGVKVLLEHGADPNARNFHATTALWNAVYTSNWPIIRQLLLENVDLNVASCGIDQHAQSEETTLIYSNAMTPIKVAFYRNFHEVIPVLVLASSYMNSEKWLHTFIPTNEVNFVDSDHKLFVARLLQWTRNHVLSAPSLKRICRLNIRQRLGRPLQPKVLKLLLPQTLQSFLLYEDLIPDEGVLLKDFIDYKRLWRDTQS